MATTSGAGATKVSDLRVRTEAPAARRPAPRPDQAPGRVLPTAQLHGGDPLTLQRSIGNAAVVSLLAKRVGVQRLASFAPVVTADTTDRLQAVRAHCSAVGPHGTFLVEAQKVGSVLQVLNEGADGKRMLELVKQLKASSLTATDGEECIKELVELGDLWGGMAGLASLAKERFGRVAETLAKDPEIERAKKSGYTGGKVEQYDKLRPRLMQFSNATDMTIYEKAEAFFEWYKREKNNLLDIDLKAAMQQPVGAVSGSAWKNDFFFPKVRSALGLPQGTGQQLYTGDVRYDNTYDWHISVAFRTLAEAQHVAINRIHLSFKHRAGGGDKSVWFNVAGSGLSVASTHGGSPSVDMITFAKTKVKDWAGSYTKFAIGW